MNKAKLNHDKSSLKQTLVSVAAAFIGIQSDKNRKRDFNHGKSSHFIIAGVLAIILFIAVLLAVVNLVIPT
jgi:DUF2970 family protein